MKRLILAASCSTLVAALLMSLDVSFVDDHARTILQALHDVSTPAETFAFMLAFLYVFGALPAILIGAILNPRPGLARDLGAVARGPVPGNVDRSSGPDGRRVSRA